jgi:hypothetical protein
MIIISDAPGQTCNRLWSYVGSVAQCIAQHKKMAILFFDETIEDFPSLLHCQHIYFPLWNKWFLEHFNGWKYYKGLTWRIKYKYNKSWNKISVILGFTNGWQTRSDYRYLQQAFPTLKLIFRPKEDIIRKANAMIEKLRKDSDLVIGVHIRRGDYAFWQNGRFFYELETYHQLMIKIVKLYKNYRVSFFISSNEEFSLDIFDNLKCERFGNEPSGAILDLYTLSICDRLIGPFSTYSRWASFIGEVPLCFIESENQQFAEDSFSKIIDFFHFENGKEIYDW